MDVKGDKNQRAEMDFRIIWGVILVGIVLIAVFLGKYLIDVSLLVFGSILFAVIMRIPGDWFHRQTSLPNRLAVVLSVLIILAFFTGVGFLLAPNVSRQISRISEQVPRIIERINTNFQQYPWAQRWLGRLEDGLGMATGISGVGSILEQVSGIFTGAFGLAANVIIFLVLAVYFAYEPRSYLNGLVKLVPPRSRNRAREVLTKAGEALKWWLIGRVIAMFMLGTLVGIGLALIGVPLPLSLAIVTGLLSFVPIIGGVVAFIPAGFVALAESPLMLFYVFLLYVGAQAVENYLLTPIVQRQTVSLAPAVALIIQLLMGILAGPVGIALAYPVAVVGQVFVREVYIQDFLEAQTT